MRSYGQLLEEGKERLCKAGLADAKTDAWLLMEYVFSISRTDYLMDRDRPASESKEKAYLELIERRAEHIPLQHLTGFQNFMGFDFKVSPNVLVPRQDTETLVEEAVKYIKPGCKVLDMCTGSGCIAVSVKRLCPKAKVTAADLSPEALAVAEENAGRLEADVNFIQTDLFKKVEGDYDVILSNPPYIPSGEIPGLMPEVSLHEPLMALDGGEDGLFFYRKIAEETGRYLKKGGHLLLEIGYDQGQAVSELLRKAGFDRIQVIRDLPGNDRVVYARKPERGLRTEGGKNV